jgi:hypothetical protein
MIGQPLLLKLFQGVLVGHHLFGRKLADEDVDHSRPFEQLAHRIGPDKLVSPNELAKVGAIESSTESLRLV